MTTEKTEKLEIVITHTDGNGEILSTLGLLYPTMDNATANMCQIDIVRALADAAEKWSELKQVRK